MNMTSVETDFLKSSYKVDIYKSIFANHVITPKLLGRSYSTDLKIAMLKIVLNDDNFHLKKGEGVGSHQAQHIIPKSKEKHPVIGISGYQVDHPEIRKNKREGSIEKL